MPWLPMAHACSLLCFLLAWSWSRCLNVEGLGEWTIGSRNSGSCVVNRMIRLVLQSPVRCDRYSTFKTEATDSDRHTRAHGAHTESPILRPLRTAKISLPTA